MASYLFYYFDDGDSRAPYFEIANCADDRHAGARCADLLALRNAASAEVWLGQRMVVRVSREEVRAARAAAQLAANPPQALPSLTR